MFSNDAVDNAQHLAIISRRLANTKLSGKGTLSTHWRRAHEARPHLPAMQLVRHHYANGVSINMLPKDADIDIGVIM